MSEPWDETVSAELASDKATPLCHRCLTPYAPLANFCPECGAPVGEYINWLPYPALFSIGHTLRIGTSGEFRRSPLTITGFFLFSFTQYGPFAPIYWVAFLLHLSDPPHAGSDSSDPESIPPH